MESNPVTPSLNDITIGEWILHAAVGKGTFDLVSAATRTRDSCETVAFKQFIRQNTQSGSDVDKEIEAAKQIKTAIQSQVELYKSFINTPNASDLAVHQTRSSSFTPLSSGAIEVSSKKGRAER